MDFIDWTSNATEVLLNPRLSREEQQRIRKILSAFPLEGHLWVSTSGSTGVPKWAALSKKAILASAEAVNAHLHTTQNDHWINPLPHFHVGGLGIYARSYLNGNEPLIFSQKWDSALFTKMVSETKATLTAMVPTQLYDLVKAKCQAPTCMRASIIGGGALDKELYDQAHASGWKPLPSYGLTECCSQVATATEANPQLKILSHVQVKIQTNSRISIKSAALLTGYVAMEAKPRFFDPKDEGWFHTEDIGTIENGILIITGRATSVVKILGENVDVAYVERLLNEKRKSMKIDGEFVVVALPNQRLGNTLHVACDLIGPQVQSLCDAFNAMVMPFERIKSSHYFSSIPRTALMKIDRHQVVKAISEHET